MPACEVYHRFLSCFFFSKAKVLGKVNKEILIRVRQHERRDRKPPRVWTSRSETYTGMSAKFGNIHKHERQDRKHPQALAPKTVKVFIYKISILSLMIVIFSEYSNIFIDFWELERARDARTRKETNVHAFLSSYIKFLDIGMLIFNLSSKPAYAKLVCFYASPAHWPPNAKPVSKCQNR